MTQGIERTLSSAAGDKMKLSRCADAPLRDVTLARPIVSADEFLWTVTRLGGAHAVIPGCLGVVILLWRLDERRCARDFALTAVFCFACIVAAKIALLTVADFSPSGHTAISTFFYASVAFLARRLRPSVPADCLALALALLVVLIAVSRFAVAGHTPMETLLGFLVGLASFELFRRRPPPKAASLAGLLSAASLALIAAVAANRLMSFGFIDEDHIRAFAQWLRERLSG